MSKYTPEQIAQAKAAKKLKDSNPEQYFAFIMSMCVALKINSDQVEKLIDDIAASNNAH